MKIDENEIKIDNLKNIIRKTILAIQKYKNLDIILAGELNSTLEFLNNLFKMITTLDMSQSNIKENLDDIESQLINLVKNYGTESFEDIIKLILGDEFAKDLEVDSKYDIIKAHGNKTEIAMLKFSK